MFAAFLPPSMRKQLFPSSSGAAECPPTPLDPSSSPAAQAASEASTALRLYSSTASLLLADLRSALSTGEAVSSPDDARIAEFKQSWEEQMGQDKLDAAAGRRIAGRLVEEGIWAAALGPGAAEGQQESDWKEIERAMDVAVVCSVAEITDPSLAHSLLSPLLEVLPLPVHGSSYLLYLRHRLPLFTHRLSFSALKGLGLLRAFNDLLRRLPRGVTTGAVDDAEEQGAGEVLMMMGDVFPVSEKSGVNLRGNYSERGIVLDDEPVEGMQVEDESGEEAELREFYTPFWSLQAYFSQPASLFTLSSPFDLDPVKWTAFKEALERTLKVFAERLRREKELGKGPVGVGQKRAQAPATTGEEAKAKKEQNFFPRFLTSRSLLGLELADPVFRRQILVQTLILLTHLLSLTAASKARLASSANPGLSKPGGAPNRPILNVPFLLSAEREAEVRDLKARVGVALGDRERQGVELVLRREENWLNWKAASCFDFKQPSMDVTDPDWSERAKKRKSALINSKGTKLLRVKPFGMGSQNLSRIWDAGFEPRPLGKKAEEDEDDDGRKPKKIKTGTLASASFDALYTSYSSASSDLAAYTGTSAYERERLETRQSALQWRATRAALQTQLAVISKMDGTKVSDLSEVVEAIKVEEDRKNGPPPAKAVKKEEMVEAVKKEGTADADAAGDVKKEEESGAKMDVDAVPADEAKVTAETEAKEE